MKQFFQKRIKEHYQALRLMSPDTLWSIEVPSFNASEPRERLQKVSVIRAVGVVFAEAGTPAQKKAALAWLRELVNDPEEKIRRYAMAALPKMGSGEEEERQLLELAQNAVSERETEFLSKTLERIGGSETLKAKRAARLKPLLLNEQKLHANIARREEKIGVSMEAILPVFPGLRIALDCRHGLERIVVEEFQSSALLRSVFELHAVHDRWIELRAKRAFSLGQLFTLRCFSGIAFLLGNLPPLPRPGAPLDEGAIAHMISSDLSAHILSHFSQGAARYRLEFESRQADAPMVARLAQSVFGRRPALLNDSREAPWEIGIRESVRGVFLELRPRLRPDPRFAYRQGDVPAASHPPLAAALARVAQVGGFEKERIWDPFCGSGLELAECLLFHKDAEVFGTDLSARAVRVARANAGAVVSESGTAERHHFRECDYRQGTDMFEPGSLTLMITNPPLGKRVPVADLEALVKDIFALADRLLAPGGRLVFVNPLRLRPRQQRLRLQLSDMVDVGFAHFHLEKYVAQ